MSADPVSSKQSNTEDKRPAKRPRLSTAGCCCIVFCSVLLLIIAFIAGFFLWYTYSSSGEHLPHSLKWMGTTRGTDCSYFYSNCFGNTYEYDIAEADFLDITKSLGYDVVKLSEATDRELVERTFGEEHWASFLENNQKPEREIRLQRRHLRSHPQHKECSWYNCQVDPTGRTDESCFRTVVNGWFDGVTLGAGGFIKFVYDLDNGRCYQERAPR